ncbi:MAG: sugar porter family MFS transporter, partial [Saprospiraceae bacterium]|nr:sugar porter family MFS transporter [Saprospiraceae bacterium]
MKNEVNLGYVYRLSIVAAIGGLLFGYDTAVISGAIGNLQQKFQLSDEAMGGAASAAIWGCVVGVIFAGRISDRFGRKKVLISSAILFALSALGSAIPNNISQLVIARFIGGLGVGVASMLSPLYISEIAPAHNRGRLVTLYQLAIVIGINLIYFVNLLIAGMGDDQWNIDLGWRYMFGSEIIPSVLFLGLLFLVPESPRWLAKQGRENEAAKILTKINGKQSGEAVLAEIKQTLKEEKGTLKELFEPGLRMAMIVGIILAIFSQITGINAIIYYAPEIFKSVGFGTESALLQTVIIGLTNTAFTFVAIWLMDKAGRRKLLLWGVTGMIICLLGMGAAFYFELSSGPLLLLFILGYIASFAS